MQTTQEGEIRTIDAYVAAGIPLTHWWIDAGWYKCDLPDGWPHVGTWQVDDNRYPGGLKAVSDHAHSKGMQLITWFEPERVMPGSEIALDHPTWVLPSTHVAPGTPLQSTGLFDLGNSEAREWLTNRIDSIITSQGIDLYRQDFNMDPLEHWRAADAPDRQGITEIKHVMGYFAYWDELRRRHPNMLIDTCASGGRRDDLETLRRAVPLLQSDYRFEENGSQGHNYGISFWIPFHGSGVPLSTSYMIRGLMLPCFGVGTDVRQPGSDFALLRRMVDDWRKTSMDMYQGDYYPLTPYSLDAKVWMSWQYDRPELGEGMIAAFRRAECAEPTITLKLRGLEPDARYTLTDLDSTASHEMTGRELMDSGLTITTDKPAVAKMIVYKREH
jgi:alpha-galactosidase